MTTLRALRALILGETWTLPVGVAAVLIGCAVVDRVAPDAWHDAGGFLLLAGVLAVLFLTLRGPRD